MGDPTNINTIVFNIGDVVTIVLAAFSIFGVYSNMNAKVSKVDAKVDLSIQSTSQYIKDHTAVHEAEKEKFNGHISAYQRNIDEFTRKLDNAKNDIYGIIVSIQKMENKVLKTLLDESTDDD